MVLPDDGRGGAGQGGVGETKISTKIPLKSSRTPEEIDKALKVEPMTGTEIVASGLLGGWKDEEIMDSAAWVEEQRRKRRERFR